MTALDTTRDTHENVAAPILTKHPAGSLRELWAISYPLMLSALSGTLMIFLDRIILARYSTSAMNSAAAAGMVFYTFIFAAISIAAIAGVFVGQYNGAKKFNKIAEPVWQMIWFCIFTIIPIGLIGIFASPMLLPQELQLHGVPYLTWMLLLASGSPLIAALSAFFVGRGKVRVVTLAILAGSIINLILDLTLVFGIEGFVPALGTKGAAIATGIAQLVIAGILFSIFINKNNRKLYHSNIYRFKLKPFMQCIKIGLPNSIGHLLSLTAWTIVMFRMSQVSFEHITVFTIGQSIWILFTFISDGSQKAVSSISSNLIGANMVNKIAEVLKSGIILQLIFGLVLTVPLVFYPNFLVNYFLPQHMSNLATNELRMLLAIGCKWMWIALIFDGITWIIAGILTAAGDTKFIMYMSAISAWAFGIVPMYIFVEGMGGGPSMTLEIIAIFTILNCGSFYLRYKQGNWKELKVIEA